MKRCEYCGRETDDAALVCAGCGTDKFVAITGAGPDPFLISTFPWYRRRHRKRLLAETFPADWEEVLTRNVAHYSLVTPEERSKLRNDLRILATEKNWEGCDGLLITEEIKVTIAAQAALMLLGMKHDYFDQVLSIVVFPTAFEMLREEWHDQKQKYIAAGQAVYRGPVLLSWDQALEEGRDPSLGRNVVIHEFAHQLDYLDGLVNGVPVLDGPQQTAQWSEVMTEEFYALRRDLRRGRETFLGDHAASNATEFFAAVSERFFTVPDQLREHYPEVYEVLAGYYQIEPANWFTAALT
jgi:hypothetical protein